MATMKQSEHISVLKLSLSFGAKLCAAENSLSAGVDGNNSATKQLPVSGSEFYSCTFITGLQKKNVYILLQIIIFYYFTFNKKNVTKGLKSIWSCENPPFKLPPAWCRFHCNRKWVGSLPICTF